MYDSSVTKQTLSQKRGIPSIHHTKKLFIDLQENSGTMDQRYQQHPSRSYAHCNGDAHHTSSSAQQQQQTQRGYVDAREKSPADTMADYAR
jgi:hypothetical protein